jgi:hypothetical protein
MRILRRPNSGKREGWAALLQRRLPDQAGQENAQRTEAAFASRGKDLPAVRAGISDNKNDRQQTAAVLRRRLQGELLEGSNMPG